MQTIARRSAFTLVILLMILGIIAIQANPPGRPDWVFLPQYSQ